MLIKSDHATLLNDLDGMANSPVYCLRRPVLRKAEAVILAQEQEIKRLKESLHEQKKQSGHTHKEALDPYII